MTLALSAYLDAVIEQQMPMIAASTFWLDSLRDCHIDKSLSLPFDRYRLSDEHRTGRGISVSFDFPQDLSYNFLAYASSKNIKLQHLALATYYAFLFKLMDSERDLCIAINTDGRYRDELKSMIGLFENVLPLRCQLDPQWSLHQLVDYVGETVTSSMKYSYFPLQRILNQHPNVSKPAFLDIHFEFQSNKTENSINKIIIGDSQLYAMPISIKNSEDETMSRFDFALTIRHDLNTNQLSCTIHASPDLFNVATINKIAQRFHSVLKELFISANDCMNKLIYELPLLLSDEKLIMQSMNNTQVLFLSVTCVHHEFVYQAIEYSQKLAVELDEQSLTYSELLHYAQVLSLNLLKNHLIVENEIICQCMERSLTMV
jgi:non-ribosomal peptide synthetase component F